MSANVNKYFRHWMGPVLLAFEDQVFDEGGRRIVLSRKTMALLMECDKATIDNYIEQRTAMGSDTFALFVANFPGPVVDYAFQYLRSLRGSRAYDGADAHVVREKAAATVHRVAEIVQASTTADRNRDGKVGFGEDSELRVAIAQGRSALDELEATLPAAA